MSRRAQPYRAGHELRAPGAVLDAMTRGRTASGFNPQDIARQAQKLSAVAKSRARRPPRASRAPRAR